MSSLTARRDCYAGVLLVAIGIAVVMLGREHSIGTLTNMHAGYFPVALGIMLAGIGAAIFVSGLVSAPVAAEQDEEVRAPDLRGGVAIIASVICFVVIGGYAGLAPATFISV